MKNDPPILLASLLAALVTATSAMSQGTAFSYQGRLVDQDTPATGLYDLRFALHTSPANGLPVGAPLETNDVPVANGLFMVVLDFGAEVFTGEAPWLEIGVRPGSTAGEYTTLSPRQPLTPTPYAVYAATAGGLAAQANLTLTGAVSFNPLSGPPFTVGNSTKVNNLNADLMDGLDSSAFLLKTEHCVPTIADLKAHAGDYAHGVGTETAVLPKHWTARLVPVRNENTRGVTGLCLSPVDLAISKLAAGREKDLEFVTAMLRHRLVSAEEITTTSTELDEARQLLIRSRLERCRVESAR